MNAIDVNALSSWQDKKLKLTFVMVSNAPVDDLIKVGQ